MMIYLFFKITLLHICPQKTKLRVVNQGKRDSIQYFAEESNHQYLTDIDSQNILSIYIQFNVHVNLHSGKWEVLTVRDFLTSKVFKIFHRKLFVMRVIIYIPFSLWRIVPIHLNYYWVRGFSENSVLIKHEAQHMASYSTCT